MVDKITDETCSGFSEALAAKVSVPGGGAAAAYVGSLAAALCAMVGNFTVGKNRYADVEADVRLLLGDCEHARVQLLNLVEEDAAAFAPLSKAYGIPKSDPNRAEVLEECTRGAIAAPLEMMRQVVNVVELLEEMGKKGSRLLLSDVGCGAALAAAALRAASMNVFVNTAALQDRKLAGSIESEADALLAYASRADRLAEGVCDALRRVGT